MQPNVAQGTFEAGAENNPTWIQPENTDDLTRDSPVWWLYSHIILPVYLLRKIKKQRPGVW